MKIRYLLACALSVAASSPVWADGAAFPSKPIRLIVPFAAGGGVDAAARLLANEIHQQTGSSVIVENRAGASGVLGGNAVTSAKPDGYTLLFSAATHVLAEHVLANPPYNPQTDFTPIAKVAEAPLLLITAPSLGKLTLKEVLATMKEQGGKWTVAIPAAGSPSHLASLMLAQEAQASPTYVIYRGTQPAATDVAGGHVNMQLDSLVSLAPLSNAERVHGVAVTSQERASLVPNIPTMAESGHPNLSYASWYGVWAPPGLSPELTQKINAILNQASGALGKSGVYQNLGLLPATANSSADFSKFVDEYVTQSAKLLKQANFVPN